MGRGGMKHPAPLRVLWAHHKPTLLLLVVALVFALFFAARFVLHVAYWHQMQGTRPQIEEWMTPRYIAKAWHIPPDDIRAALHLPDDTRRQTLEDIAKSQGRPVEALLSDLTVFLHSHMAPPS